ncbi:polysaccharide deacetylase family protein [Vibrio alfacsensis]|uniref:polysaccharide deacetylase family protein n=1 Tax=Vibrio alfacsensis TaxID=1074311 RepID=UPI0040676CA7
MIKVIMYHYVREFSEQQPKLNFLHIDDFRKQLDYFQENGGVLTSEDWSKFTNGDRSVSGFLLTFDDGFVDHYKYVYPELKKRGLLGIFYINSKPILDEEFCDVHAIHYLLSAIEHKLIFEYLIKNHNLVVDQRYSDGTYSKQDSNRFEIECKRFLNYQLTEVDRGKVLSDLFQYFDIDIEEALSNVYLKPEQITEMHEGGMLIGAHAHSHNLMGKMPYAQQKLEVVKSTSLMKKLTGVNSVSFCFPYGGVDSYNNETLEILRDTAVPYAFVVSSVDLKASHLTDSCYELPRFDCNEFKHGSRYEP